MAQLFRQRINFVELTKLLERETCDTLTFTYGMGHSGFAVQNATYTRNSFLTESEWVVDTSRIKTPLRQNIPYSIPSPYDSSFMSVTLPNSRQGQDWKTTLINPSGNRIEVSGTSYTFDMVGNWSIEYKGSWYVGDNTYPNNTITFLTPVIEETPKKQIPSITDICNRILNVGLVRRYGEPRKYRLDSVFAAKYANVDAPEFFITRCTLREALLQVGGYIHAEPRLVWNEGTDEPDTITFDELGGDEEYTLPSYIKGALTYDSETNPNEYCGQLDSYVDNLVNTINPQEGTIVSPSADAFITPRTESVGLAITDNTVQITTEFPIYRVTKLEMGYVQRDFMDAQGVLVGDITPYLFEKAEYDTLTGYDGEYPYAKKFALCYAQGDNKITGLGLKAETATELGVALQNFAAYNIAISKTGGSVRAFGIANMAFRVTYIPLMGARVKQRKAYRDRPLDNTLFFNQGANTVEASYYGEAMKGNLMKVGNELEARTYRFRSFDDLPKCGQVFQGKYVVKVDIEFEQNFILATVYTSTYNKLSQYVGLKSNYRLYDVSERQTVDRHINYSENVIIGDAEAQTDTAITTAAIEAFAQTFTGGDAKPIANAVAQLLRKDLTAIQYPTLHSVLSVAMGNSLLFAWQFEDNFSAGSQATHLDVAKKIQKYAAYGNEYGEGYYLSFGLLQQLGVAPTFQDQLSSSTAQGFCDRLPIVSDSLFRVGLFNFKTRPLIVDKDSREALRIATQLHFVANRPDIVFGSLLGHNNPLVSGSQDGTTRQLVLLPRRINALNDIVNVQSAYTVKASGVSDLITVSGRRITIAAVTNTTAETFKSWAIIDSASKRLYIGENIELPPNGQSKPIVFNF